MPHLDRSELILVDLPPGVVVRPMREDDIQDMVDMGDGEAWNIPYHDLVAQYRSSPNGSFTAELNGERVGKCHLGERRDGSFLYHNVLKLELAGNSSPCTGNDIVHVIQLARPRICIQGLKYIFQAVEQFCFLGCPFVWHFSELWSNFCEHYRL
jgi:hypothetical protein